MKTISDLQNENSLTAVQNVRVRGLREGSTEWLRAYETELSQLVTAAAAREGIQSPKASTPALQVIQRLAARGINERSEDFVVEYQREWLAVQAEANTPPPPPPARAAPAPLPFQRTNATGRTAASAPRAQLAPAAVVVKKPTELQAAIQILANIETRKTDPGRFQAAYETFISHRPMQLRGGVQLISAISDAGRGRCSAQHLRNVASATLSAIDDGPVAA
jgi:hypothetical protein